MKYTIALLLLSSVAFADMSKNPDRYPSIGVDYTQTHSSLNLSDAYLSGNTVFLEHGNNPVTLDQVTFDFRSPLNNYVTFDLHGGPNSLSGLGSMEKGYAMGASIRVYLPGLQ